MKETPSLRVLRDPEVEQLTGLSRTTRWRLEKLERFPKRRKLSPGAVGWIASEIEEWIRQRALADHGAEEVSEP